LPDSKASDSVLLVQLNIHHLELFYYVARHGGISEAVRKIPYGIQQPAVSSQVQQLEETLGTKLFQRRPFRLTPAGEELFGFIAPFFNNLPRVAEKLSNSAKRNLRVAASGPALRDHLPGLLRALKTDCPGLVLSLRDVNDQEAYRLLLAQEIDIAFTLIDNVPRGLKTEALLQITPALVVPDEKRFRDINQLLEEIAIGSLPLVTLPLRERICQVFTAYLRKFGLEWSPAIETCSFELIHTYVLNGFGAGLTLDTPALVIPKGLKRIALLKCQRLTLGAVWQGKPGELGSKLLAMARELAGTFTETY
jgi:DNA-binding transcriptional LysR family regulator